MPKPVVQIEGLAQVRKALKAAGEGAEKELKEELANSSVMSLIVQDSRRRLEATYRGSRSRGKAASAIRVGSSAKAVYVTVSKSRVPYYGWLDFGGDLKPSGKRRNRQKRPFIRRGRAIYPAIDAHRPQIRRVALQAMENTIQKAGLHE